ncbi:acyltransferase family protein [Actinomarinicola tropica]|uniref:Acyltransferase family protein n=1 Tax=Actinomarinicola tropica TaxID=2789776 RepID=A0A5Q2RMQ5_9ACTN|nr:acyltransferase family protein [Actinomarinicola tropica]QGG95357.1 acyltransferase family protein [Actinomarinicola tropica]
MNEEDGRVVHGAESRAAGRVAALDGLRGVAVLGVLAFHAGLTWMPGGFLGVSAFFTLSGFLIAGLLLDEWDQHHRIDLRAFWGRRVRRLLPASLVCLVGIAAFGLTVSAPVGRLDLRGDILAALAQVANWRFVLDERSYADLFAEPSPVLHFWSLAIEEQAYLLLPLVVVGVLHLARRREAVGSVLALLAVVSTLLMVAIAGAGHLTQAYYGTHTRAAEILWGAAAAAVLGGLSVRSALSERGTRLLGLASWPAIAAMGAMWATATAADLWVYRFALPLHPFLTLVVVLAVVRGVGPARLLSWSPLAGLGRISYGVYLYHWPLFLWLDEGRTGLEGPPLLALRLGATLVAALVSYRWIEQPIRRLPQLAVPRLLPLAALPALVVVGALVVGSTAVAPPRWAETSAPPPPSVPPEAFEAPPASVAPAAAEGGPEVPAILDRPLRLLVVGDSVSRSLGFGLDAWAAETGAFVVWNTGTPGCGIVRSVEVRSVGGAGATPEGCTSWPTLYADRIETFRPDLVVVLVGAWDAGDHRLEPGDEWRWAGDPTFDAALRRDVDLAAEVLTAGGATVAWLTYPHFTLANYPGVDPSAEDEDTPRRLDHVNDLVAGVVADHEDVGVVDLAGHMEHRPGGVFDTDLRPDGVHFDDDGALSVSRWLGPELLRLAGYSLPSSGRVEGSDGSTWLPD